MAAAAGSEPLYRAFDEEGGSPKVPDYSQTEQGYENQSMMSNSTMSQPKEVTGIDAFFNNLYRFHYNRGIFNIVLQRLSLLFSIIFSVVLTNILLLVVDYEAIRNGCSMGAFTCANVSGFRVPTFSNVSGGVWVIDIVITIAFVCVFLVALFKSGQDIRRAATVRLILKKAFQGEDTVHRLLTLSWEEFLVRVLAMQPDKLVFNCSDVSVWPLRKTPALSPLDVHQRIMRKENVLIAVLNRNVVRFHFELPLVAKKINLLSSYVLLLFRFTFLDALFSNKTGRAYDNVRKDPEYTAASLKRNFFIVGILALIFSPLLCLYTIIYFVIEKAWKFYKDPKEAAGRSFSLFAKWKFREFNELDHTFEARMGAAEAKASSFVEQFPSRTLSIIGEFISFLAGALAALLITTVLVNEAAMGFQVFGRNLWWYLGIVLMILATCRGLIITPRLVVRPYQLLAELVSHIHYMPTYWKDRSRTLEALAEINELYTFNGQQLLEEVLSPLIAPYLFLIVMPKQAKDLAYFVRDGIIDADLGGDVICFSEFDEESYGNPHFGAPAVKARESRTSSAYRRPSESEAREGLLSGKENVGDRKRGSSRAHPSTAHADVQDEADDIVGYAGSSLPLYSFGGKMECSLLSFRRLYPAEDLTSLPGYLPFITNVLGKEVAAEEERKAGIERGRRLSMGGSGLDNSMIAVLEASHDSHDSGGRGKHRSVEEKEVTHIELEGITHRDGRGKSENEEEEEEEEEGGRVMSPQHRAVGGSGGSGGKGGDKERAAVTEHATVEDEQQGGPAGSRSPPLGRPPQHPHPHRSPPTQRGGEGGGTVRRESGHGPSPARPAQKEGVRGRHEVDDISFSTLLTSHLGMSTLQGASDIDIDSDSSLDLSRVDYSFLRKFNEKKAKK